MPRDDDDPFDDDAPELECDHEEYDLDILTGRATCVRCNHRWFMSDTELKRDQELRPGGEE